MNTNLRKIGRGAGIVVTFLVIFEAFIFLRWTFLADRNHRCCMTCRQESES